MTVTALEDSALVIGHRQVDLAVCVFLFAGLAPLACALGCLDCLDCLCLAWFVIFSL
jgi:hypothetical protein